MNKETVPYYGMYTDNGNMAVDAIVNAAKIAKLTWPETYEALRNLAKFYPEIYGEATDTMVREMVYDALGFTTDFYV